MDQRCPHTRPGGKPLTRPLIFVQTDRTECCSRPISKAPRPWTCRDNCSHTSCMPVLCERAVSSNCASCRVVNSGMDGSAKRHVKRAE
jgi:hypothetical protein